MLIGVPKEIKDNENRVGMTPAGVQAMVEQGHKVFIQKNAGLGSGITDDDYESVGAEILSNAQKVYKAAEMIIKVKEPLDPEFDLLQENQIIFTYLHLAAAKEVALALIEKKITAIACETVQSPDGSLPLLTPMSEVAGRLSVQIGAHFLEKPFGGRGVLLGGVPGVEPAKVIIIGGGVVGTNAAKMAIGLGAEVTIIDNNASRLVQLDDLFRGRIKTLMSNNYNIGISVKTADLLIGAVLIAGAKCPILVTAEMVKQMKSGAVIVDVAIDQGGSIETIDRVTTHSDPVYEKYGVVHYAVANMPALVPCTSTVALTNLTLPYALELANKGWKDAVKDNPSLIGGVNTVSGKCTYEIVAKALNLEYTPLEKIMYT